MWVRNILISRSKIQIFLTVLVISVRASCEQSTEISLEQAILEETETELEENVDSSNSGDNSEITVPLNESLENSESTSPSEPFVVSDSSTTLNDTEVSDNSTYNATDSTVIDGEKTEMFTEGVNTTEISTVEVSEIITVEATDVVTDESTVHTTEELTEKMTEESTIKEVVTESTTTTTTELPTTPIDILCPYIPDTEIDLKYRNETFDLYMEEFMRKNPLARIYKSPGFPGPYAENLNCTLRFVGRFLTSKFV